MKPREPRVPPRPIPTKRRLLNAFWIREPVELDGAALYALLVIAILALLGLVWTLVELAQ